MLATLNLQLSAIENTDTNVMPAGNTPLVAPLDAGVGEEADFANFLRAGFEATSAPSDAIGELLPPGGNALPLVAATVEVIDPDGMDPGQGAGGAPAIDAGTTMYSPPDGVDDGLQRFPIVAVRPADQGAALLKAPYLPPSDPVAVERGLDMSMRRTETPVQLRMPALPFAADPAAQAARIPAATEHASAVTLQKPESSDPTVVRAHSTTHVVESPVAAGRVAETLMSVVPRAERGAPKPLPDFLAAAADTSEAETLPELRRPGTASSFINATSLSQKVVEPLHSRIAAGHGGSAASATNAHPVPQSGMGAPLALAAADPAFVAANGQGAGLINTPVGNAAWGESLTDRVMMMANSQLKTAEFRLTPAELGPLRVQVSIDDGAASVVFHAQHAVTREAIEQAMPRLRELLAENGISLSQANVGEDGAAEGRQERTAPAAEKTAARQGAAELTDDEPPAEARARIASSALLDTFA